MAPDDAGPVTDLKHYELSPAEIEAISDRLREGGYLDEQYRQLLFRDTKEAELRYGVKETRGSILARTMAVPFQVVKRSGDIDGGWANKLIFGDNLQALKTLVELKKRGELVNADGSHGIRLCYIDPPFATKREFRGKKGQLAYRDKVEGAEFVEFLRKRLVFIHELLTEDGTLYLHLDTNKVHYMKVVLDEIFGPANFRNEIIWKRSDAHSDAGGQGSTDFGRIHDIILRYTKSDLPIFNPQFLPLPESTADRWYRHVEEGTGRRYNKADITGPGGAAKGNPRYEIFGVTRYWRYSRERMQELIDTGIVCQDRPGTVPYRKRYLDESKGVPLQDIWTDIPMLRGYVSDGERTGYPTQKPAELLKRIINASSREGDLVLDCFGGSGTSAVAAEELNRRWVVVDCGKLAIYTTQRRLLARSSVAGNGNGNGDGSGAPAPFELIHAGLYDNELIEDLPFEQFEKFALELFECRPSRHAISGIPMSGTRQGAPVHVFPFDKTEAEMGAEYIEDLHARIGSKVSGAVCVIVPVAHCDPGLFEDIIQHDRTTYFVLRVPYSAIEDLHEREFQSIGQPASREEVNDALDSFGFDFLQKPVAKLDVSRNGDAIRAQVQEFRRGGLDPDDYASQEDYGRGDLAMVLLDTDYDGDTFTLDEYLFAEDLARGDWTFEIAQEDAGDRVLVVLMDTHGNELAQALDTKKLAQA